MLRLSCPWLPHVLPFPLRPLSNLQIRCRHRLHRRREPLPWPRPKNVALRTNHRIFEVSNLVLDLDAEDSTHVRPYNEDLDGVPDPSWLQRDSNLKRVEKRIVEFQDEFREHDQNFKFLAENNFNPWRITDYDILSVALESSSTTETAQLPSPHTDLHSVQVANLIFEENGIPLSVRNNTSSAIAYMLRRQQQAQRQVLGDNDKKLLKEEMQSCKTFLAVNRLVTNVSQTPKGCLLVSRCTEILGLVCEKLAKSTPPVQMLSFLNNLIINLDSQDLHVRPSLLWCAYKAALNCSTFTTAQRYLGRVQGAISFGSTEVFESLELLRQSMDGSKPGLPEPSMRVDTAYQLSAIYGLLTGHRLGERTPQPSLRGFIFDCNDQCFYAYIDCLVNLGAFRTIWHIWHMLPDRAEDNFIYSERDNLPEPERGHEAEKALPVDKRTFPKAKAFTHAFYLAIEKNGRFAEMTQDTSFAHAVGQYDEDCQLDIKMMLESADILSTRVMSPSRTISSEEISDIFGRESVQESMVALQSFLQK